MKFNFFRNIILFFCLTVFNLFTADQPSIPKSVQDAGRHFIMTLPKYNEISEYDSWLEQIKPSGVMLTEYHMQDRAKTKQICQALQDSAKRLGIYPLLISVDFEGGIVSRGADVNGFVSVPSPYKLATMGKSECFLGGKLIGHQLRDTGIWMDFAPSLDLFDSENYILATRCLASDPKVVASCGKSMVLGMSSEGVLPTIKHFPGLKSGIADTHTDNVVIKLSAEEFESNVLPFCSLLSQGLDMAIMISHAVYDQFGDEPASLNSNVVSWIKKYNPNVLLITDDASMQSYHRAKSESEKLEGICTAAKKSIQSGFDLIIFSASPDQQINVVRTLNQSGFGEGARIRSKVAAVYEKLQGGLSIRTDNFNENSASAELAKKVVCGVGTEISASNKVLVISVDLNKIRPATSFEVLAQDKQTKRHSLLASMFESEKYAITEFFLNPVSNDSVEELKNLIYNSAFQNSDNVILQTFFYGGGVWNKIQKKWLKLLKPYSKKLTVVSLGHPYESKLVPNAQVMELGSFHSALIKAAFNRLKKKL